MVKLLDTSNPIYKPPEGYPEYGASKQKVGEWEVRGIRSLLGIYHLHFLFQKGRWEWVLRYKKSGLCSTTRCRMVNIKEL